MTFRNLLFIAACALAFTATLNAQVCTPQSAVGTYLSSISGWAAVPTLGMLPVVAQGVANLDAGGTLTPVSDLTTVVGGMIQPPDKLTGQITVKPDCSVTFTVKCANGCSWEGIGVMLKTAKEFHFVFTKTNGYPLTATAVFRQMAN